MTDYYATKLAGTRLKRCYEVASPRVRRYLEAEIVHALERIRPSDRVLELGCGYGRIAVRAAEAARLVVGIDTAAESLELARREAATRPNCAWLRMDALALGFASGAFDVVLCLQNGICAFGADPRALVAEALRVTRPGGTALFSSYADGFWEERLGWFEAQAAEGLVGPLDREASREGVIACRDGFRAGRMTPDGFGRLCAGLGLRGEVEVVDHSSVFCELRGPQRA